jgi:hypothetical protein
MSLRTFSVEGDRTRRTEITVEESQRTVLLMRGSSSGDDICPLCGQSAEFSGCIDALHSTSSLDQVRMPAPGVSPAIAAPVHDPQKLASTKLRVLPRRLR